MAERLAHRQSRDAAALEERLGLVTKMIATLRGQPMEVLPGFGEHLGYDGKAIESHSAG